MFQVSIVDCLVKEYSPIACKTVRLIIICVIDFEIPIESHVIACIRSFSGDTNTTTTGNVLLSNVIMIILCSCWKRSLIYGDIWAS